MFWYWSALLGIVIVAFLAGGLYCLLTGEPVALGAFLLFIDVVLVGLGIEAWRDR